MRWKKKVSRAPPEPKVGDKKTELFFAWLPMEIGDMFVWLERYAIVYELRQINTFGCRDDELIWGFLEYRTQEDWKF
jgi:hypothetical protein